MSEPATTPGDTAELLTQAQQAGLDSRRVDQDRTLATVHRLEAALSTAATGRESTWRADVAAALEVLDTATGEEQRNADQPDSLLSDIARTQPMLRPRVRGLRAGYRQLRDRIAALSAEIADSDDDLDADDVRRRLAWLLSAIRHQRARESDLVYEAYYEAFHRDVEADVGRQP
jgi:hypothetical protein